MAVARSRALQRVRRSAGRVSISLCVCRRGLEAAVLHVWIGTGRTLYHRRRGRPLLARCLGVVGAHRPGVCPVGDVESCPHLLYFVHLSRLDLRYFHLGGRD